MSLALATLIFEWRRYLAAIIALSLSGLLVLVQVGLFTGLVGSQLSTVEKSRADLFILAHDTEDLDQSWSSLPRRITPLIYLNPDVVEVASAERGGGQWINQPGPGEEQKNTYINTSAVDPVPGAVTLPVDYPESTRVALLEPMAIAVDASDLKKLGVHLGSAASIRGKLVHVRAILHGHTNTQQSVVVVSRDTAARLARTVTNNTGPLMVRIKDPAKAEIVRDQLNAISNGAYRAWTKAELDKADEEAVVKISIIGMLLTATVFVAILIGVGITSQTLRGAIASNIKEFASLRALGISMGSLRLIVMELSAWVGVAGLAGAATLTALAGLAATAAGLPMVFMIKPVVGVSVMLMTIAVASGVLAMGVLKKSQPADLLR